MKAPPPNAAPRSDAGPAGAGPRPTAELGAASLPEALFEPIDLELAAMLERWLNPPNPMVAVAVALTSRRVREGHSCLDLRAAAGQVLTAEEGAGITLPDLGPWRAGLNAATTVVGPPGSRTPLILDSRDRLYLRRLWQHEQEVAQRLRQLAFLSDPGPVDGALMATLHRYFPPDPARPVDWQMIAGLVAARQRLCVISGGPGTGKTRTVVLILALLIELAAPRRLRVALAAPTGKAAARLQDALRRLTSEPDPPTGRNALLGSAAVQAQLPDNVQTIHRLLGVVPYGRGFRHGPDQPLPVDVLVVDEASMVDLTLMARLLTALPPSARLILVGDRDQLPSVEAGQVFADLCPAEAVNAFPATFAEACRPWITLPVAPTPAPYPCLAGRLVQLQHNYRSGDQSGIARLSRAINEGDSATALGVFRETGSDDGAVSLRDLPAPAEMPDRLRDPVLAGLRSVFEADDVAGALAALPQFRILCAVREGPYGVEAINALVTEILRKEGWIPPNREWFRGRQILITRNDDGLRLYNGDLGLAWPTHPRHRECEVFFPGGDDRLRGLAPVRLPPYEPAFALTVHKSQGSEFDRVLLILPAPLRPDSAGRSAFWDGPGRILTRELVYTAVTRAARHTEVWAAEAVLTRAIQSRTQRGSGLADLLAAPAPATTVTR